MSPSAALVGAGVTGRCHLDALRQLGVEVRGVCASSPDRSMQAATAMALQHAYPSFADVLVDDRVDVVHVLTPNVFHYEQAREAILAGKHVVCEKPLTTAAIEAAELVDLAGHAAGVTAVGFTKRHYTWMPRIRSLIAEGSVGAVRAIRGGYLQDSSGGISGLNWRHSRSLAGPMGVVADLGCHWTDLACHLTGLAVEHVAASLTSTRNGLLASNRLSARSSQLDTDPHPSSDYAQVLLQLTRGVLAMFVVSQISDGNKDRMWIEIDADDGAIRWSSEQPNELRITRRGGPTELHTQRGRSDLFREFLAAVYERVADRSAPVRHATFEDGHIAMVVSESIRVSSETSQWVEVGYKAPTP